MDGFLWWSFFVAYFDSVEIVFIWSFEAFYSPLKLFLCHFSVNFEVEDLYESFNLPEGDIKAIVFDEFKDVLNGNPVMPAAVYGHYNSFGRIPVTWK